MKQWSMRQYIRESDSEKERETKKIERATSVSVFFRARMCQDCFGIHPALMEEIENKEKDMIQMVQSDNIEDFDALSMQLHNVWMEVTMKDLKTSMSAQWLINNFNRKVFEKEEWCATDMFLLSQLMQATLPALNQVMLRLFMTNFLDQPDSVMRLGETQESASVLLLALALRHHLSQDGALAAPIVKQLEHYFGQMEKLHEVAWLNVPYWRMIVSHALAWKNEQAAMMPGGVASDLQDLYCLFPDNLTDRLSICKKIFESLKQYDDVEGNMFWFAKELQAGAKAFKDLWMDDQDEIKELWATFIMEVTFHYCDDLEKSAKLETNVVLFRSLLMMPHIFKKHTPAMEVKDRLLALGRDVLLQLGTNDEARIVILNIIRNKHVESTVLEDYFTFTPMPKDMFIRGVRFIVATILERRKEHHGRWATWLCEEPGLSLHVLTVPLMEILFKHSPELPSVYYLAESFAYVSNGVYAMGHQGQLKYCWWEKDFIKARILLDPSWQKIACYLYHISETVAKHMEKIAWKMNNATISETVNCAKAFCKAKKQLHIYDIHGNM